MPAISRDNYIWLPGSKSIAARALILNHVYKLDLELRNIPDCDDTRELSRALQLFGTEKYFHLGSGGTSLRFFLALAASTPGFDAILDCSENLRKRPLNPLIEALQSAGAEISCIEREGYAPLRVKGKKLDGKGVTVCSKLSSQFASALILVSDLWSNPFESELSGIVSKPYAEMSLSMRQSFRHFTHGDLYRIEPDWSAASYFYEYALLNPGKEVKIGALIPPDLSLQGDSFCAEIFGALGVSTSFEKDGSANMLLDKKTATLMRQKSQKGNGDIVKLDMRSTPDLTPAVTVALAFAGIPFEITGIGNLRFKESDRISTLSEELSKAGIALKKSSDSLCWHGEMKEPGKKETILFDSHNDHRIAMALAVVLPLLPNAEIRNPECIAKSFPDFFPQLAKLSLNSEDQSQPKN